MNKKLTAVLAAALATVIIFSGCDVIRETVNAGSESSKPSAAPSDIDRETWVAQMNAQPVPRMDGIENESVVDWEENYLVYAAYPKVVEKSGISADIEGFVQNKINQFKEEVPQGRGRTDEGAKPELTIEYEPYAYEDAVIGFKVTTYADSGLSRTDGFINTFEYSIKTEEKLGLDDVFDSETDYLGLLSELVRGELQDDPALQNNLDQEKFDAGTAPGENNFSNFVIGDREVTFFFNANQIAPASAGSFEASLSFDELDGVLNWDALRPNAPVTVNAATGEDLPGYMMAGEGDMSAFSIEGIDPDDKVVALTFDDGPSPHTTEQILNALSEHDAVATFFVLGQLAAEYPEIIQKIYENGNEIGNHSYDHADFKQISLESVSNQIDKTNQAIFDAVGARPIIVRPPYGNITDGIAEEIGRACILWTVDPEDWKHRDEDIDYNNVMNVVRDGDIVLMHDIYQPTADAAVRVIRDLDAQGYTFVTVTQLMQIAQARGIEPRLIVRNGAREDY